MPSRQIELKSDIANLFKDLEEIASSTQVVAPHVPKIESADITELFSGLNEAHEEAKIEVELRLSIEEKEKLEAFSNLVETFDTVIKEEPEPQEEIVEVVDESAKLEALEQLFSELIEPEPVVEMVEESEDIVVEAISEEPTIVEKKADLVDKAIAHLDVMQEKTEIKEEVSQIATLRKEFDNFRSLIAQQVASSQMSGAGSGEVRLEFLDDVNRDSVKVDGRFLQYNATSKKIDGGDFQSLASNIIPSADNTFDLGSASKQWRNLFLGGSTLVVEGASLAADELTVLDGVSAGTITASKVAIPDSNKDISGFRNLTITGQLSAATLDISGNVDIDGTLEADAITVNGATLSETIADTIGAMVSGNTESGITVTYDDNDNTLDFSVVIPVLDEDDLASDSATQAASQQSIKSYVDAAETRTRAFAIAIGAGL